MPKTLASLLLAAALTTGCRDSTPHVIAMPVADVDKPGSMVVTGTATLEVAPDCADLTMTIAADGGRPGDAAARVQQKQQELLSALIAIGIEAPEIKLSHVTLNPIYEQTKDGIQTTRVAAYRAEVTVTATTRSFDKIGAMMEAGGNAGASSVSSQFRRSDLASLKKRVREMALVAAKDKAAQTAKTLGIELGRIVSVAEVPNGTMWGSPYFPANAANEVRSTGGGVAIGGALQPLTLDVTIGFELSKQA